MFFEINARVTIGQKVFKRVNKVEITSDREVLEDVATIMVPATARLEREGEFVSEVETRKEFSPGDEVVIELGYNGQLREEFRGYVRRIHPTIPVKVECEDAIYTLRRKTLKASFQNISLKELLEYILGGSGISIDGEVPEVNFTAYYLKNVSAARALQKLKETYGLVIYFPTLTTLFVGLAEENDGTVVKYSFGENVIDNNLEWTDEEDVLLKIKAIHVKPDNTTVEKEFGDEDGELRTVYYYDIENEAQLRQRAEEELKRMKYSGYRGSLTTFLLPNVQVGNVARLVDNQFAEREGDYLVKKVETTVDGGGARRKVEVGIKVDA